VFRLLENILKILSLQEKRKFFRLILVDIVISILDIVFLVSLVFVIGYYTKTFSLEKLPPGIIPVLDRFPLLLIGVFLGLFGLKNLFGFVLFRVQFRFVYEVASRISRNNLLAYLDGTYHDYINLDSSVHVRRISQQPVEFSHYVLRGVQMIICNIVLIILTIIPIIIFNSLLFALLFVMLLPPVILTAYVTKKRLAALRQSGKKNRERSIQYLQEALSGYIESNIYHRKEFFTDRYQYYQGKFNAGLSEHQVMQNLPSRLIEVFAVFGLFLLIVFNTYISGTGSVQVLLLGGFMAAAYKIIPGIVKILNSMEQVRTYSFTVKDLLAEQREEKEPVQQNNTPIDSIAFSNAGFGYKQDAVLSHFNMVLRKGDFAGLSGVSGKGKTTIINLLLGFLEPDTGGVLMNDTVTTAKERQGFWSRISYIKQQSFFIHDSVRNNITLQETFEKERLAKVLRVTGVDHLLADQPEGIDTILSENGKNISGGQRQRIMLARALYKDADLVILDEPFNELDRVSEDRLLDHFRELATSGKIVLLITHNRESLSFCNKIVSLDE
jgi:ABC-type multidrug transport system fused ATPase/permease subunit